MTTARVASSSLALLLAAAAVTAACGAEGGTGPGSGTIPDSRAPIGSASCGTTKAVFTVAPVALGDFNGWVPLGNLGPPAHTFPTDHQYIYISNPDASAERREVNLVAPTDIVITRARRSTTTPSGVTDYTIEFSPCAELYGQFGHVKSIAPAVLAKLGSFDQQCTTYSPVQTSSVSTCNTSGVAVKAAAGEIIGTAGGPSPYSLALDFWLWDARVPAISYANASRWQSSNDKFDAFHVVAASDYFSAALAAQIAPRVGSFDGRTRRTAQPAGGTIAVDVPGTAMGDWFNPTQPTIPESVHLAIAPDNVDSSRMTISIGTSLPGWSRGLVLFTPASTGLVNRDPAQITADGNTYCFEGAGSWVLLARMTEASSLRLEALPQTTFSCAAAQPWTFSAAAFEYKR